MAATWVARQCGEHPLRLGGGPLVVLPLKMSLDHEVSPNQELPSIHVDMTSSSISGGSCSVVCAVAGAAMQIVRGIRQPNLGIGPAGERSAAEGMGAIAQILIVAT
jgi:hypothetical protein